MSERPGDWMQTFSGKRLWPLDPQPEEICIEDIAHSLAFTCRFGGHARFLYTTAQHSLLVASHCNEADALAGLLHDAAEAYVGDCIRPIKRMGTMNAYCKMEKKIQKVIFAKWGLAPEIPGSVYIADAQLLATEARDVMGADWREWNLDEEPLVATIEPMKPERAEELFLSRFRKLLDDRQRMLELRDFTAKQIAVKALRNEIQWSIALEMIAKGEPNG